MSQVLHTGAVTVNNETGGSPGFSGSGAVGGPPQIDDASDATYVQVAFGDAALGGGSANDYGFVVMDRLSSASGVTDITTVMRLSAVETGGTANAAGVQVALDLLDFTSTALPGVTLLGASALNAEVPVDGSIVNRTFSLHGLSAIVGPTTAEAYIAEVAAWIAGAARTVIVSTSGAYTSGDVVRSRVHSALITAVGGGTSRSPAPALRGSSSVRFIAAADASETALLLNGPTGAMPHADTNLGGYAISEVNDPHTIAMDVDLTAPQVCWVRIFAQWYTNVGGVLMPGSKDALTDRIPFGNLITTVWEHVSIYTEVHAQATHWKPLFVFYANASDSTPMTPDTEVFIDCIYIPEDCRALAGKPYLDGDQSYGQWEGAAHASPSIYDDTLQQTLILSRGFIYTKV